MFDSEQAEKAIFQAILAIDDPRQRQDLLDAACRDDHQLRARLESLLAADDAAGEFLKRPAAEPSTTSFGGPIIYGPGTWIGPYKLLQQIGEGGFGVVFMAEQAFPIQRRVAVKVIKPGMDTREVVARFEAERQALALMDHPNIAKVLDGGATESGRPYFVMELVKGVPITKFCDDHRLVATARIKLFVSVCYAVQHAHQKGIIHRDIKPSNVLVTLHDGKPVAKVIDFGVAKAISQSLTAKTMFTAYGQMIGTPQYMSPEQAEMSGLDVDTRSDIYSLGALLYELMTGEMPIDMQNLRGTTHAELQRRIREEEPPTPSARIAERGGKAITVAKQRQMDSRQLFSYLRGDLDLIVMKSLEKDRTRRYETAAAFAVDLQRFLNDEPVEATPPSIRYRFGKFARRNKTLIATGTTVVVVLVAASLVSSSLAIRAIQAQRLAGKRLAEVESQRDEIATARQAEARLRRTADEQAAILRRQLYASELGRAANAFEIGDLVSMRVHLDACPEDLRGWEWSRLDWLMHPQQVMELAGRELPAYTANGQRIVTVGKGEQIGAIKIWDARSGRSLNTLQVNTDEFGVTMHALSPQDDYVVTGDNQGRVVLLDLRSGQKVWAITAHSGRIDGLAYSPDGRRIASVSWDGTLKMLDAGTGEILSSAQPQQHGLRGVRFDKSGRRLVTAAQLNTKGTAKIWDATSLELLQELDGHQGGANCAVYSRDGKWIITGGADGTLKLWEAQSGSEIRTFFGHNYAVLSVAFSPDGKKIVSGGSDRTIRFWDAATARLLKTQRGHVDEVFWLAFSPDGSHLATFGIDAIRVWNASSADAGVLTIRGFHSDVQRVIFSSDGGKIAFSGGRSVRICDVRSGMDVRTLYGHTARVNGLAWHPDGNRLASSDDHGFVRLWDATTGGEVRSHRVHEGGYRVTYNYGGSQALAFHPNGLQLVFAGATGELHVLDAETLDSMDVLPGHRGSVSSVAYSHDGRWLASAGDDGTIGLWNIEMSTRRILHGHTDGVCAVRFSPDGRRLLSGSRDTTARLWDVTTGTEVLTFSCRPQEVTGVAFLSDGTRIVTSGTSGVTRIWSLDGGSELMRFNHGFRVNALAVSPGGATIATGATGGTVKLWEGLPPPTTGNVTRDLVSEARSLVDERFRHWTYCGDVVTSLQTDDSLAESLRDVAISMAIARGDDPQELDAAAQGVFLYVKKFNILNGARESERAELRAREALAKAERACTVVPECAEYQFTRGMGLFTLGRYPQALEAFELARSHWYTSGRMYLMAAFAMTHHKLGDKQRAQSALASAWQLFRSEKWENDVAARSFLGAAEKLVGISISDGAITETDAEAK